MKRIIHHLLLPAMTLFFMAAGVANAQEYAVKKNRGKDNWFIEIKGGGSAFLLSDWDFDSPLLDVTTPYVGFAFGKHFNPIFGVRFEAGGWEYKNKFNSEYPNTNSLKANYLTTSADFMFNLTNGLGKVKVDRGFDLYLIMGVGYMRHLGFTNGVSDYEFTSDDLETTKNFLSTKLALQGQIHVSKAVDINLEISGNYLPPTFMASNRSHTINTNATLGIAYKFKKRGFEMAEVVEPGLVSSLNDEINRQRGIVDNKNKKIARLNDQLHDCQQEYADLKEKLAECESKKQPGPINKSKVVITYKIGKTDVSKEQLISIYNVAQMLKKHPTAKVEINAYADVNTGSAKRNKYLTEKRAETIVRILTENYGIEKSRITSKAYGSESQPYDNNDWNRVVVIIVK